MNNGENNQIPSSQDYFTAGVGLAEQSENPLDDRENIDLSNFAPDRDISNIGNAALESSLNNHPASSTSSTSVGLGQIVELKMPPLVTKDRQLDFDAEALSGTDIQQLERHFSDGKVNHDDLSFIKEEENKLSQDGKIDEFYELWRAARQIAETRGHKGVA